MIKGFGDKSTELIFKGDYAKKLPRNIQKMGQIKLDVIDQSDCIEDLYYPSSNRFKALSGNFQGFYSIRINQQWRIVFRFIEEHAYDVQITDYH